MLNILAAPFWSISIHAPTRGATRAAVLLSEILPLFQSTLPREERPGDWIRHLFRLGISIHAPTRGATLATAREQSRLEFQSTLPREERPLLQSSTRSRSHFNPRSHERSDSNIAQKICLFLYNTDNKYIIR